MRIRKVSALVLWVAAGLSINACGKKEKKKAPAPQEEVTPQEQPQPEEKSPELAQNTSPAPASAPSSPEVTAPQAPDAQGTSTEAPLASEATLSEEDKAIADLNAYLESTPVEARKAKLEEDVVNAQTNLNTVSATVLAEDATEEQKAELNAQITSATEILNAATARLALFDKINASTAEVPATETPVIPSNTETPEDGVAPSPSIN